MKNKKYIEKAKLSFYQKICLVESLLLKGSTKGTCFEIIEKINSLRNNIAHKLEPKKLEAKVRDLLYCMFPNNKVEINKTDKRIKYLKLGIASLIGRLSSLVNKYKMTQPHAGLERVPQVSFWVLIIFFSMQTFF